MNSAIFDAQTAQEAPAGGKRKRALDTVHDVESSDMVSDEESSYEDSSDEDRAPPAPRPQAAVVAAPVPAEEEEHVPAEEEEHVPAEEEEHEEEEHVPAEEEHEEEEPEVVVVKKMQKMQCFVCNLSTLRGQEVGAPHTYDRCPCRKPTVLAAVKFIRDDKEEVKQEYAAEKKEKAKQAKQAAAEAKAAKQRAAEAKMARDMSLFLALGMSVEQFDTFNHTTQLMREAKRKSAKVAATE